MQKRPLLTVALLAVGPTARLAIAQAPKRLTLSQAEQIALRNHPRIGSASLIAEAAKSVITEARAPLYPLLSGNFTSVGAEHNSTLAAGTVQTSSLYSRVAAGVTVSQLITDFGRTANLAESAKLRASAQEQVVGNTRAAILIQVDQAYYQALAAGTVLKVAQAVVDNRRLSLRQVQSLAQSSLKSTLDVSFEEVAVSEAELALFHAENDVLASRARLTAALGAPQTERFELTDEPLPPMLEPDPEPVVEQALKQRPDLAAMRLSRDAAHRFAQAEKALSRPTVSLMGVAGDLPATDPRLHGTYSAAGVNVSIPILNGKLYAARRGEAELRAQASDRDVEDLTVQVSEEVRVAWLEANTAFRRLDVTARLVAQAQQSLRLAQTRYDNGLGGIVELNQAQVSQVSAEITAAGAKYDYLSRRAALAFVMGALR
ncbi:MAG TPA: TolC family protein [Candidatus Limnocylindrales bacterium]|nr:TolC family protein [Bryobacteraceae bacterium]HXJ14810.1 TolC family protein [Candidatus Limnocylindrales bacterium]